MWKRSISFLLALMMLTVLPFAAMATELGENETERDELVDVTRAQWVRALVETFSMTVEEDNYPDNYFSDITAENAYYRDIMVATEFGLIDVEAGLPFQPDAAATREFAAHTLNYALGYQLDADVAYTFSEAAEVTYPDDIQVAIDRGWFALSDGAFLPGQAITTAESEAMLADAAAVLAGDVVDENHENIFTFSDEVIHLSPDTVAQKNSDTEVLLVNPAQPIEAGSIFAVYLDELPTVYQADAVSVSDSMYTITVTQLNMMEYLENVDAEGTYSGDLAEFQVAEDVEALYVLEDGTEVTDARMAGSKKIKSIYFNQTIGNLNVVIELFDMQLDYHAEGSAFDKTSIDVSAVVSGKTFCHATLAFGASVSDYTGEIVLGTYPIGSLGNVTVTADISIDGSVDVTYGANFKVGVAYDYYSGFRIPREFRKTHFSLTVEATIDFGVTAAASVTGVPFLSAQCSTTVGMRTNFVARYRGADQTPNLCIHTDSWIYAEASAYASVGIDAPKILGSDTFKKTWSDSVSIWDRNSSPVRSVTHFEDGTMVGSCSYGETDFFGYASYYHSGSGSRYANGGVSAVVQPPSYTYSLDEDNNATITKYSGGVSSVAIPATIDGYPVTAIGNEAFKGRTELMSVTLPNGVVSIAYGAFADCTGLKYLSLPDGLLTVGAHAFARCYSLVRVVIPDTVTEIGAAAFAECTALQSVHLPKSLVEMGAYAFYECDGITTVEIPKSLEGTYNNPSYHGWNYGPFYNCDGLTNVTFEEGTTLIANGLFANCPGITSITIPDTVTLIESDAFSNCTNLAEISFSIALTQIDSGAFQCCDNLDKVEIPDTVTEIGACAFAECTALQSVHLPKALVEMGAYAFYECDSITAIEIPKSLEGTYNNPSYEGWNYGPFYNCDGLTDVTFEEGTTLIANGLFANCPGITSITIPDTVTVIESDAFDNCTNLAEVTFSIALTQIDSAAFRNCDNLPSAEIPDTVTEIGACAFAECTALQQVTLPKSLVKIGAYAFYECDGITAIEIPKSLEGTYNNPSYHGWSYGPFYNCDGLTDVTFEEGTERIVNGLFANCPGIQTLTIPESISEIQNLAFENCSGLTEIKIPETVTVIGNDVFINNTSLTSVEWPSSLTEIPRNTFNGCVSLPEISIPENVETIGDSAFCGCTALKKVVLPETLTMLANNSFRECVSLSEINLPDGLQSVGACAFYNCDSLTEMVFGTAIQASGLKGEKVFYDCDALTRVVLPDTASSIGTSFFESCDALKDVTLGRYMTSVAAGAFRQCGSLEEITIPYYVTEIGENAFNSSPKLTKVYMHRNVASIASNAFSYPEVTVIYGVSGTYPETWCAENGYQFVANEVKATGVTLNVAELTMNNGTSQRLILTMEPANTTDEIVWRVKDESVVTVDATGLVTAGWDAGTTTVDVYVGDVGASCTVTVVKTISGVRLSNTQLSLEGGSTHQLTAKVQPDGVSQEVTWSSSDETVASVDETGLVTAHTKGEAIITAASVGAPDITNTCTVTVTSTRVVTEDVEQLESAHNYANNSTDSWEYIHLGAEALAVTFDEQTEIEDGYDSLIITDSEGNVVGTYTGTELAGQTIQVPGCSMVIQLVSDNAGNKWGFKVTNVEAVPLCDHSITQWLPVPGADATCTEPGQETGTCACGQTTETRETDPLGHSEVIDAAVESTCTAEGLTEGSHCERCGEILIAQEATARKEHTFTNGVCTECGTEDSDCGHENTHIAYKAEATCMAEGYTGDTICDDCGSVVAYGETIAKTEHTVGIWEQVEPSCTSPGLTEGRYCQVCEAILTEQEKIPMVPHSYADGKCSECGAEEPDCGHTNTRTENVSDATCTKAGYTGDTVCTDCGQIVAKGETIPKAEHSYTDGTCTECGHVQASTSENIFRLYGTNRFTTAFAVADQMKENLGVEKFDTVIVASGSNFADALGGSYLSAVKNAPILLSYPGAYDQMAKNYIIANLNPGGTVYILGGTSAVPEAMEEGLSGFKVKRLAGDDRFGTNLAILNEAGVADKDILVCTGLSFADSLSASASKLPILLVWKNLSEAQKGFLSQLNGNKLFVIGGTGAVSESMEKQVSAYGEVTRIGGGNRFETSVLIAEAFFEDPDSAVLAYAWNYPDGLCGGALAATMDAPLILTMTKFESAAADYIQVQGQQSAIVLGGESLISDNSVRTIFGLDAETPIPTK